MLLFEAEVFAKSHKQLTMILATLALSTVAFAQDGAYQIGYAANLNIGDSEVNLSNDGNQGGFIGATPFKTEGNICVNVYTFDPAEEEIACCACLVTPNGLNALLREIGSGQQPADRPGDPDFGRD